MKARKKKNGIFFRENRGKWGYRVCLQGHNYKRFAWATQQEARAALNDLKAEVGAQAKTPQLPPTALETVVAAYLVASAEDGRSQWRLDGLRGNFESVIIPFFGADKPIGSIQTEDLRRMVLQRKRKVKPKTLWHDVTNLDALYHWAMKPHGENQKPLVTFNPVADLDMRIIGNTKHKKPPLNIEAVERGAEVLDGVDRAYYDFERFTGLRMDEGNRVRWDELNLDEAYFHCTGTKTDEADAYLPLAPVLVESLRELKKTATSAYVFPGRSSQTKGRKIYSRRRLFEKITRLTARCSDCHNTGTRKRRVCEDCGSIEQVSRMHRCSKCKSGKVNEAVGCIACGSTRLQPGVKLTAKDLRDYFASTVETDDPRILMSLMRHTNLTTTTKYLQANRKAMQNAVKGFGKKPEKSLETTLETSQHRYLGQKTVKERKVMELLRQLTERSTGAASFRLNSALLPKAELGNGGGGQSRTVDAADMSRVL